MFLASWLKWLQTSILVFCCILFFVALLGALGSKKKNKVIEMILVVAVLNIENSCTVMGQVIVVYKERARRNQHSRYRNKDLSWMIKK